MEHTAQTATCSADKVKSMLQRAVSLLTHSEKTWEEIKQESTSVGQLYKEWIVPFAAISPIMSLIKGTFIGYTVPVSGQVITTPFMAGVVGALVQYAIGLGLMYVAAVILSQLASKFGGSMDIVAGLKNVFFAALPSMVASVLMIVPMGSLLYILVGLFCIYLFYLGSKKLSNVPAEKHLGFFVLSVIAILAVNFLISLLLLPLFMVSA
ncbi:MAG: Yip1 family protein [Bdellovibrionota bacterium]|nr:MAG: Yip1 family protein [Bdellovibrionota bacterium]